AWVCGPRGRARRARRPRGGGGGGGERPQERAAGAGGPPAEEIRLGLEVRLERGEQLARVCLDRGRRLRSDPDEAGEGLHLIGEPAGAPRVAGHDREILARPRPALREAPALL